MPEAWVGIGIAVPLIFVAVGDGLRSLRPPGVEVEVKAVVRVEPDGAVWVNEFALNVPSGGAEPAALTVTERVPPVKVFLPAEAREHMPGIGFRAEVYPSTGMALERFGPPLIIRKRSMVPAGSTSPSGAAPEPSAPASASASASPVHTSNAAPTPSISTSTSPSDAQASMPAPASQGRPRAFTAEEVSALPRLAAPPPRRPRSPGEKCQLRLSRASLPYFPDTSFHGRLELRGEKLVISNQVLVRKKDCEPLVRPTDGVDPKAAEWVLALQDTRVTLRFDADDSLREVIVRNPGWDASPRPAPKLMPADGQNPPVLPRRRQLIPAPEYLPER